MPAGTESEALLREAERFLYREAALLDDRRWEEWLALFDEGGIYWVPSVPDQPDPVGTISLFHEDRMLREMRLLRLTHKRAFSQEFPTRQCRIVGNVLVEEVGETVTLRSSLHLLEYRKEDQRMFGGRVRHELRRVDGAWRIRLKRVDLLNCDAPLETLQVWL